MIVRPAGVTKMAGRPTKEEIYGGFFWANSIVNFVPLSFAFFIRIIKQLLHNPLLVIHKTFKELYASQVIDDFDRCVCIALQTSLKSIFCHHIFKATFHTVTVR